MTNRSVVSIMAIAALLLGVAIFAQEKKPDSPFIYDGAVFSMQEQPFVMIGGSDIIRIETYKHIPMVTISHEGVVTYGKGYKPDDGAKTFWEALAREYPIVCEKLETVKPAAKEK